MNYVEIESHLNHFFLFKKSSGKRKLSRDIKRNERNGPRVNVLVDILVGTLSVSRLDRDFGIFWYFH